MKQGNDRSSGGFLATILILKILTNPIYAGSYAYGKTITEIKITKRHQEINQRKKIGKRKMVSIASWTS